MKIYFDGIIYSWQKNGGIHMYIEELLMLAKQKKGIDATLLLHTPSHPINTKSAITIHRMCNIRYVPAKLFSIFRKCMSPINKFLLERYFKKITQGIFHSTYYTTYTSLRIPQVVTVHDMTHEKFPHFFNSRGARRFIKNKQKCIEQAHTIICISEATRTALLTFYPSVAHKIQIVHQGLSHEFMLDTPEESHMHIVPTQPYFLFVGHRGLYKNFEFFLRGFAQWNTSKKYKLIVAGGNSFSREETALCEQLHVQDTVQHLGFVATPILRTLYKHAMAFVYPSLDEGFGLPILEALSSHATVIASDIPAFRELGKDMLLYFNPTNTYSLIDVLEQAVRNQPTQPTRQQRALYVRSTYSWEKCRAATYTIYQTIYAANYPQNH